MLHCLHARFIARVPAREGKCVDLVLIEPNGDEHRVTCLCRPDGTTDISEQGDGSMLMYLNDRYGMPEVCGLCREITLQEG